MLSQLLRALLLAFGTFTVDRQVFSRHSTVLFCGALAEEAAAPPTEQVPIDAPVPDSDEEDLEEVPDEEGEDDPSAKMGGAGGKPDLSNLMGSLQDLDPSRLKELSDSLQKLKGMLDN